MCVADRLPEQFAIFANVPHEMVATTAPKADYSLDVLATIDRDPAPQPMRFNLGIDRRAGWRLETAAA